MGGIAPFRADHVGSYLRPKQLVDARERHQEGSLGDDELRAIEDTCIRDIVKRQEDLGLEGITDGEFRRTFFHTDFLQRLDGVTITTGAFTKAFRRDDGAEVGFRPPTMRVDGPIKHVEPIQGADFAYLASVVRGTPKVCIPAPSMLHFRGGREAISEEYYPNLEGFFDDLTVAYRAEIADLADRGCRYLQMDDTNLAYLCDPEIRERTAARGDDPDTLTRLYCRLVNDSICDRPKDMVASIHLCRGNFKSAWVAEGGYEPVAEALFNEIAVDAYFLEYDSPRAGDFTPLRFVPKDKTIVLGLLTTKTPELEPADEIRRRIDEAAAHVPVERLCLSPQCGFSTSIIGNELTIADQDAKLRLVAETARRVWS